MVEQMYHVGQLVEGLVSRTAQFGAFVSLDPGIEALLHVSQVADPAPADASTVITEGERLLMRVISIEADKQRLGLSLKEVTAEEKARWEEQQDQQEQDEVDVEAPSEVMV
jgi:4-hydroxy-3-methylbut-2-enyl diphosphate reductase